MRVACEKVLITKLALENVGRNKTPVAESYKWKPMPDGEEDMDGYATLQWGEIIANQDMGLDHSSWITWGDR